MLLPSTVAVDGTDSVPQKAKKEEKRRQGEGIGRRKEEKRVEEEGRGGGGEGERKSGQKGKQEGRGA